MRNKLIDIIIIVSFCLTISVLVFWSTPTIAKTYIQGRTGYVHQPYPALHPEVLNRDEHDYLGGFMLDAEIGKQFETEFATFLVGVRLQQIREYVQGIYTKYQIDPDAEIDVYRTSLLFTAGLKIKVIDDLSLQIQFNYGPKLTFWYQDGEFKESFWRHNIPLDISLEYKINNNWSLVGGTSNSLPIYTSRTHIFYLGFVRAF